MTDRLEIDGITAQLEAVEEVAEILEIAEQGPPGPPGPASEGLDPDIEAALVANPDLNAGNPVVGRSELISQKYAPALLTIVAGTLASGSLSDIITADDGNMILVNETAGGLTVEVEYHGVTDFNSVVAHVQYAGGAGHVLQKQAYNWGTANWDAIAEVTGAQSALTWESAAVPNATAYIGTGGNAGVVKIRRAHLAPFNAAHYLLIEYAGLVKSLGGSTIPIPTQAQAENLSDISGSPFLWPVVRLMQMLAAYVVAYLLTKLANIETAPAGAYTLQQADTGKTKRVTGNVTLPVLAANTQVQIRNVHTSAISLVTSGTTLTSYPAAKSSIPAGAMVYVQYEGTTTVFVQGPLA